MNQDERGRANSRLRKKRLTMSAKLRNYDYRQYPSEDYQVNNNKKTRPLTGNVRARIIGQGDQPYISFNKGLVSNFKKSLEKQSSSQIEALANKKGMRRNATIEEKAKRPLVYNSDLIEEE